MDWNAAAVEWKAFRNEVRGQWGRLSDLQLDLIAGSRVRLHVEIGASYGITHDQAEAEIAYFEARNAYLREVSSR